MGKSLRWKIAVVSVVVLAVAGAFLFSAVWKTEEKAPVPLKILPDKVDLQAKDVLYTEVGRGDVKYEIRAKTVRYLKKENTADFEDVNVKVIMPKGKVYTITSDRGTYDTEKKNISMTGHVVVESDIGEWITTDRINYIDAEKKIHTDAPVKMVNKDIEIKGIGMTFMLDNKHLTLFRQVRATVRSTR